MSRIPQRDHPAKNAAPHEPLPLARESEEGMKNDQPKNPQALDVPVNLAMLTTNTWTTINWDQAEIRQRNAPIFSLKGQQLKLLTQESFRVVNPSQLWLWLADEQGNQWHVDIQCRDGCVQAQVTEEPRGFNYSSPPTR